MIDLSEEWIKAAIDDLESARELLKFPHLTNIVSFHCHQAIEKSFKAVIEKQGTKPEKTHNIERLFSIVSNYIEINVDEDMLERINELYIDSRYPGDLGLLPDGKPSISEATEYYNQAASILNKLKQSLMQF